MKRMRYRCGGCATRFKVVSEPSYRGSTSGRIFQLISEISPTYLENLVGNTIRIIPMSTPFIPLGLVFCLAGGARRFCQTMRIARKRRSTDADLSFHLFFYFLFLLYGYSVSLFENKYQYYSFGAPKYVLICLIFFSALKWF